MIWFKLNEQNMVSEHLFYELGVTDTSMNSRKFITNMF